MPQKITSLNDVPSISAYLRRIGAEERSLRVGVVKQTMGNYWKDLATIRFDPVKKAIKVMPEDDNYKPTEAEEKSILEDMDNYVWPAATLLGKIFELPEKLKHVDPDSIFEFRNKEGMLVMLQHRSEPKGGGDKAYRPWTYFDDGQWHMAEPEGPLPLWGMEFLGNHSVVFVHEGAKAARAMHRLTNPINEEGRRALAEHPWGASLSNAAHLGWIGGALNPGRTDWSQLTRSGVKTVYIVADNDSPGIEAISKISRHLAGMQVFSIKFNHLFPASFDMADPWPETLFVDRDDGKFYIGPLFDECLHSATWAIDWIGGKKKQPVLRDEFKRQWGWALEADVYVNLLRPAMRYNDKIFNGLASGFGHGIDNIAKMLRAESSCHYDKVVYRPDHVERVITHDGSSRVVNLYVPPRITARTGDSGPWLEFMEYLIPDDDERRMLLKWCATLIARPEVRMSYAVLMVSETQGIGKNTLGEKILAPLVGRHNCSFPQEKMVVDSEFNTWMVNKRFVFVGEIYAGRNWKAANELKSCITDRSVTVNEKFMKSYETENWIHVMACSNSTLALKLDLADRRWMVPTLVEAPWPHRKWVWFNRWIEGDGLHIVRNWAEQHGDYVFTGEHAPTTKRKEEMQRESESEAVQLLRKWCEANDDRLMVVAEKTLRDFLKQNISDRTIYETNTTLRKVMETMGWKVHDDRINIGGFVQSVILSPALSKHSEDITDRDEKRKFIRSNIKVTLNDDEMI